MFQRRQTQASVSSGKSSEFVHSMYSTKANELALAESGASMRNGSSTFATQNVPSLWDVVDNRTELFINAMLGKKKSDSTKTLQEPLWVRRWLYDGMLISLLRFEL